MSLVLIAFSLAISSSFVLISPCTEASCFLVSSNSLDTSGEAVPAVPSPVMACAAGAFFNCQSMQQLLREVHYVPW